MSQSGDDPSWSRPAPDGAAQVRAAGGVVWSRWGRGPVRVLVVHRPRYDDWSLPKGKAEPGEGDAACALREVREETGLTCVLGVELPSTRYRDGKGRDKEVRYWAMEPLSGFFAPGDEIDQVRWLPVPEAAGLLTYDHDRPVLAAFEAPVPD